jgi:signal transduction histidine kinase
MVTHYVGIQNDITERVAAETNLRIRTKRLDAVFNLSPDGFVAFDTRDMLTNANPAFLAMTGFREQDLIGLHVDLFDIKLRSLCETGKSYPSTLAPAENEDDPPVILKLLRPQMRVIQRDLRVADIGSGEKVVYFRDITRETEVDRMKSEFLSTAAHELRTPLASIFGFSELMLTRNYDEGRVKQMVGTIHRQAGLLVKLINELLDLARIEARAGKDFNYRVQPLAPVIENVVAALLVGNETRHVAVSLPSQPPLVKIDADKFSLSLTNVLANAYKYSPKGGAIELDVIAAEADGEPRIGVRVRDHGIGMSAEEVARVFERFYRADPSGNIPGTGLGMCLVKEIIELHGGQVEVASEKNVGTTVTLWLPAANASELEMAA